MPNHKQQTGKGGRSFTFGNRETSQYRRGDSEPTLETLRAQFGLTRTEAIVALALLGGESYQEIADRLSVSYHTIHTHVKSIHVKAGVSSNVRLAALVSNIERGG